MSTQRNVFEEAKNVFLAMPTNLHGAAYLRLAVEYEEAGKISWEEFELALVDVCMFLEQQGPLDPID